MYKYIAIFFTFLLVILQSSCSQQEEVIQKNTKEKIVKIFSLQQKDTLQNWYEYPAEIFPYHNVDMAFEVSGKIVDMYYHMGDKVKKNSVIAKLDDTIFKSNYQVALANYKKANKDFLRYKKLYESNNISKSNFESAKQLKSVREAELSIAKKNFDNTKLIAEFDGVIAKKYIDDFARITAKQPILTLQDNTKLKVKFFIPESDMLKVSKEIDPEKISKKINLHVSVGDTKQPKYKAKLLDIATKAEDITRTFEITLLMENPKEKNILPGMSAKVHVSLNLKNKKSSIFLPAKAIFTDSTKKAKVWIVQEDDTVTQKTIKMGRMQESMIEILEGLKGDEKIVISGVNNLQSGDKVKKYQKLDK